MAKDNFRCEGDCSGGPRSATALDRHSIEGGVDPHPTPTTTTFWGHLCTARAQCALYRAKLVNFRSISKILAFLANATPPQR